MMIKFENLSDNARIWVYTSDRLFSAEEKEIILTKGNKFVSTWAAHGDLLKATIEILDDCFLILAVDEGQAFASGCSIDSSVKFLQGIEKELQISLLDWQNMAYNQNNKIVLTKRTQFSEELKKSIIDNSVLIYNTNANSKSDFLQNRTSRLAETNFKNLLTIKS